MSKPVETLHVVPVPTPIADGNGGLGTAVEAAIGGGR